MSRRIDNAINNMKKARIEGLQMLEQKKITWKDFSFIMEEYEHDLKNMGVNI